MNIVNRLTLRQLRLNKKRTLVTIIGTIISAAMITVVATLGFSLMDVMQREAIERGGEWHVLFTNINQSKLDTIQSDKKVKTAILSRELGFAYLDGSQNMNKPYLFIKEYSKEGFENNPIHLLEGRLPVKPDELVISEEVLSNAKVNYELGDVINLSIGKRATDNAEIDNSTLDQMQSLIWNNDVVDEKLLVDMEKSYTIVGIIERPEMEMTWAPGYSAFSYIDENIITPSDTFDVSVIFKKVNNHIFKEADRIAAEIGNPEVGFNNGLLRFYGVMKDDQVLRMLYILTGIIMFIIMIGSVSLIYNAFAISVSERSRYLGMLSSVGATKKQKRSSVFFEGAVIGAISIPLGIIAGYIGLAVTYLFINPLIIGAFNVQSGFRLLILPSSLITSVLVSGATIMISTYIPARRASNISAIDAIRQVTDIKFSGKQVRTSRLTRKLFGIEGDLGLKNLKRNRGRYKATVFSLIISIVIFLVVSYFTDCIRKSYTMTQDGINFDIQAMVYGDNDIQKEEIIGKITSLDDITEVSRINILDATTWVDEASIADYLKAERSNYLIDGKYPYQVTINVLDDASLQKYAAEIGIEVGQLKDTDKLSVVVIDTMKFKDQVADKYIDTKTIKASPGDQMVLSVQDYEENKEIGLKPVTVAALTGKLPMGIMTLGKTAGFHIIMSKEVFDKMIEGNEKTIYAGMNKAVYLNSKHPLRLQEQLEKIQNSYGNSSMSIYNVYQFKQREIQSLLIVSVFTYAFIILITAICVANIINTISTSIALRKREFAMLKSVGITPKGFNRMLNYESIFYGIKALIYGIPIGISVMYLLHKVFTAKFVYGFSVSILNICIIIAAVFAIVGIAMLYSSRKVRKENIIDALKQEII